MTLPSIDAVKEEVAHFRCTHLDALKSSMNAYTILSATKRISSFNSLSSAALNSSRYASDHTGAKHIQRIFAK